MINTSQSRSPSQELLALLGQPLIPLAPGVLQDELHIHIVRAGLGDLKGPVQLPQRQQCEHLGVVTHEELHHLLRPRTIREFVQQEEEGVSHDMVPLEVPKGSLQVLDQWDELAVGPLCLAVLSYGVHVDLRGGQPKLLDHAKGEGAVLEQEELGGAPAMEGDHVVLGAAPHDVPGLEVRSLLLGVLHHVDLQADNGPHLQQVADPKPLAVHAEGGEVGVLLPARNLEDLLHGVLEPQLGLLPRLGLLEGPQRQDGSQHAT
mmetsp:Transcript_6532/g.22489  ORF Transcript_6532/g.22489 Transcript_6532/m.22489 type:complete len:261 (-) Transcript_6532:1962-2744(-)